MLGVEMVVSNGGGNFILFFLINEERRNYNGGSFPFLIRIEERTGDPMGILSNTR
jgi:hypothetical protein